MDVSELPGDFPLVTQERAALPAKHALWFPSATPMLLRPLCPPRWHNLPDSRSEVPREMPQMPSEQDVFISHAWADGDRPREIA